MNRIHVVIFAALVLLFLSLTCGRAQTAAFGTILETGRVVTNEQDVVALPIATNAAAVAAAALQPSWAATGTVARATAATLLEGASGRMWQTIENGTNWTYQVTNTTSVFVSAVSSTNALEYNGPLVGTTWSGLADYGGGSWRWDTSDGWRLYGGVAQYGPSPDFIERDVGNSDVWQVGVPLPDTATPFQLDATGTCLLDWVPATNRFQMVSEPTVIVISQNAVDAHNASEAAELHPTLARLSAVPSLMGAPYVHQGSVIVDLPTNRYSMTLSGIATNNADGTVALIPPTDSRPSQSVSTGRVVVASTDGSYMVDLPATVQVSPFVSGTLPLEYPIKADISRLSSTSFAVTAWCPSGDIYDPTGGVYYATLIAPHPKTYDRPGYTPNALTNDAAALPSYVDTLSDTELATTAAGPENRRAMSLLSTQRYVDSRADAIARDAWNWTPAGRAVPDRNIVTLDEPLVQQGSIAYLQSGDYFVQSYEGGDWYSSPTGSTWRIGPAGRAAFEIASTNRMLHIEAFAVAGGYATIDVSTNWITASPYVEFTADLTNPQWLACPAQTVQNMTSYWRIVCPGIATQRFFRAVDPSGASEIRSYSRHVFKNSYRFDDTVWDDLRVGQALRTVGSNQPSLDVLRDAVRLYTFADNAEAFFTTQLPHRYKPGTNLRPHLHWTTAAASPSGSNIWRLEYTIAPHGSGTYGATATVAVTNALAGKVQYGQYYSAFPEISGATLAESSCIIGRIYRTATGSNPMLVEFDIHFEADKPGTDNETP